MPIPKFDSAGTLPPGIHAATLREVTERFGIDSDARRRQIGLLREVVEAAKSYASIKRILVWGSFVTAKPEPGDLDYSIVVSVGHYRTDVLASHRRFFIPSLARRHYGADFAYLVIGDYPLEYYVDRLDFMCHEDTGRPCGIIEIGIRGEILGDAS